eukprot:TRINITY_DN28434_c0_g1_i1.p1 TRINITY_DN28434_c0_g1~~TRINITY_DN28434_c0_g1_i1.p1  ORF type:complete len:555 (+),score=247.61 TRINITY_DN28434_c0_g1_i1:179-1666(+)
MVGVVHYVYFKVQEDVRGEVHEGGLWEKKGKRVEALKCNAAALRSLLHLLRAAKFKPIPEELFEYGVNAQNFSRALHAELGLDLTEQHPLLRSVLSTYPLTHPQPVPLYCNKVLLFTTGYTFLTSHGQFFFGKCNALLEIGIDAAKRALCRAGLLDEENVPESPKKGADDAAVLSTGNIKPPGLSLWESKQARTRNVRDALSESWLNLFRSVEVREIAFERLFMAYPLPDTRRRKEKASLAGIFGTITKKARGMGGGAAEPHASVDVAEVPKGLSLSLFERLPVRDLGLALPEKLVSTTNVDNLSFVVELLLILLLLRQCVDMASAITLDEVLAAGAGPLLLLSAIPTLLYRLVMLALNWYWALDYYRSMAKSYIDTKVVASDRAAASELYELVKDQELKTALIAYWLLWQHGELSAKALDEAAESLIKEHFGMEMDYDVPHALQVLQSLGMACRVSGTPNWKASVSPSDFLQQPVVPWTTYLRTVRESVQRAGA